MVEIGTRVRVVYPGYAAGFLGYVKAQEESGRWLVELESSNFTEESDSVLLSLEESDFEVIEEKSG